MFSWATAHAIDVICQAVAEAAPEAVPACSGGANMATLWWGVREATGKAWLDGTGCPIGLGGNVHGDGSTCTHAAFSGSQVPAVEVREALAPWLIEKAEYTIDSCGAGRHRGGPGIEYRYRMLGDVYACLAVEHLKLRPWGLLGGTEGTPPEMWIEHHDGRREKLGKTTGKLFPEGSCAVIRGGGGGGYGPPAEREIDAVQRDVREGYITEAHARHHYPHAFA
jgi:N-methylhydantoinase B